MIIDIPDNEDVVRLPTNYKPPPTGERMLVEVDPRECVHFNTTFEVDVAGGKCRCLGCNKEVSPFFVLESLMRKESQWNRARAAYQGEMKRLAERSSTKCRACGAMTRISR